MTRIKTVFFCFMVLCSTAMAAEPPAAFMSSTILIPIRAGVANRHVTVKDFSTKYSEAGKITWDKTNETNWVMRINMKDEVTGKVEQIAVVFQKNDGDSVLMKRIRAGNEDFTSADQLLMMGDKLLYPVMEAKGLGKDAGDSAEEPAKVKAPKKAPGKTQVKAVPADGFLKLNVSRPEVEGDFKFKEGVFTVSYLFSYVGKSGDNTWRQGVDPSAYRQVWIIEQKSKSKTLQIELQEIDKYPASSAPIKEAEITKIMVNGKEQKSLNDFYAEISKASGQK
jgi:hypothetical protein